MEPRLPFIDSVNSRRCASVRFIPGVYLNDNSLGTYSPIFLLFTFNTELSPRTEKQSVPVKSGTYVPEYLALKSEAGTSFPNPYPPSVRKFITSA